MGRPKVFSRRVVDPVNSVTWFAMDAFWLAQWAWPAFLATGLTLATGAMLLHEGCKRRRQLGDDLALNAWIWMNACWLASDLAGLPALRYAGQAIAVTGAVLLMLTLLRRGPAEALRQFRRLRLPGR